VSRAQGPEGPGRFFREAFDRKADPCLEGRVGRLLEYLDSEQYKGNGVEVPPWDDMSLRPEVLSDPGVLPEAIVGEHLRVFVNECTWTWSRIRNMNYAKAKDERFFDEHVCEFSDLYNAAKFKETMLARGVVITSQHRWSIATDMTNGCCTLRSLIFCWSVRSYAMPRCVK